MTPQERELLTKFLVDLNNTPAGLKDAEAAAMIDQAISSRPDADAEAAAMIDQAISSRPDAAYVLVQHAIMADEALHRAQAELAQLRAQVQPQGQSTGFLGSTVPPAGGNPWTQAAPQTPPQPQYAQPQYTQAQPGGLFGGGGGLGSFLRNAGTTAAGVVAGDMLFSSLGGLFGGHHGFGGGFGGGGFGGNETVILR
eukprot:gene17657-17863_t